VQRVSIITDGRAVFSVSGNTAAVFNAPWIRENQIRARERAGEFTVTCGLFAGGAVYDGSQRRMYLR
jgi:hypothetical protein